MVTNSQYRHLSIMRSPNSSLLRNCTSQICRVLLLVGMLLIVADSHTAKAQYIPGRLSEEAEISILTLSPAEAVYTTFGHTAIRLKDSVHDIDRVYNYGTFDENEPYFFLKYFYGNLRYFLSVTSFDQFKQANTALGRSIVSQTLNLSQKQVNKLAPILEKNSLPENRSYPYRFFSQNCVTQAQDLISKTKLIHSWGQAPTVTLSTPTYRQKIAPYVANNPWLKFGINLMLGSTGEQTENNPSRHFLPDDLHLFLANATDSTGKSVVQSSQTIAKAQTSPSDQAVSPIFISWVLFLVIAVFTAISLLKNWQSWWIDRILFGTVGLLGIILAFGSLFSLHQPLHYNWNLLWALPTHLFIAARGRFFNQNIWLRFYFWITITLNGVVLIGGPALPQQLPTAIIPLVAGLTLRSTYRLYVAKKSIRSHIPVNNTA